MFKKTFTYRHITYDTKINQIVSMSLIHLATCAKRFNFWKKMRKDNVYDHY